MDSELDALLTLVKAASGRATIEPVVVLGIVLASPWRGERTTVTDRPVRREPGSDRELVEFTTAARPMISDRPMPQDSGMLAWMRHRRLAMPVADVQRAPSWLHGDALAGGWLALPPSGRYTPPEVGPDIIEQDGRVAFLHLLASQIAATAAPTAVPGPMC